jgi:hypothetical protein
MREIRTSGLMSGDGKQGDAEWPKPLRPSSTLPLINGVRPKGQSLASAIRVYLLDFYRKGGTSQRRPNENPANDTGTR